jgi:hypothetical protein
MSYITDYQQKFTDLATQLKNQDQLRREANGGNSILFTYPPAEEKQYIEKAKEIYADTAEFIDVSRRMVDFIDEIGWDDFKVYFNDMKPSYHKVFFDKFSTERDLFDRIIDDIVNACQNNKIPFLIRTGCLYGTAIENVNIMEHKTVINLPYPLVVFYPSKIEDDSLYFLNFKPASKYRCAMVK